MMRRGIKLLLGLAILGLSLAGGLARAAAQSADGGEPDSYVLLVGIQAYADQDDYKLSELAYARQDLDRMAQALPYMEGFAKPQITELFGAQATKPNVLAALARIKDALSAHPERSALVYFSGHGLEVPDIAPLDEADGSDEVFVLYDFPLERHPPDEVTARQYLLLDDELQDYLAGLPDCRRFVFIADSCHSGGLPKDGGASESDAKRFSWPELGERGLVTSRSELITLHKPAELVILAAQDGETALVSNVHQGSVLTYALNRALVDDAATCDHSGDGVITLDELRFYLAGEVDRVVQAEYNMKGQQVQIASGQGSGMDVEAALIVAKSSARAAGDSGELAQSYWKPLAIQYTGEFLAQTLGKLGVELPWATAEYRFAQPVRPGDAVGWTLTLAQPASIAVASFDGKGNATIVDAADYGAGLDWRNVPAGQLNLPGGAEELAWPLRLERRGLEFAAVLLLPPGKKLADYPTLRDALNFGYRNAVTKAVRELKTNPQLAPASAAPQSYAGLLILPYEVQP